MAKGSRAKEDGEKGTHQIRINADLGEMISWIIRVEGGTTASLLDPMIRAQVTARYKKHEVAIDKIKEAQAALDRVEREAKAAIEDQPKGSKKRPE